MSKQALRDYYYHERIVLSEKTIARESKKIAQLLVNWMKDYPISYVHSFLPIASRKEIDTFTILQEISETFPEVSLVIPTIAAGERQMKHYLYTSNTQIRVNKWGIPEADPTSSLEIKPKMIDLVITPLLAFDVKGNRIGYGGGYYDSFFADCKPNTFKVGVSLFPPIDEINEIDEFDVPLDLCITPEKIWTFKKSLQK